MASTLELVLLYLVLSVPFFCAANAIGLALVAFRDCPGRIYAADLIGAGLGSVTVLALLYWLWPEDVLKFIGVAGLLAACVGAIELGSRPRTWSVAAVAAAVPRRGQGTGRTAGSRSQMR